MSRIVAGFTDTPLLLVDGISDLENPVIKTGLVCFNHPYRNRSFEIVNHTDMPLEFVLACNLDPRSTELNFSLSYTSSKWVNSFTIRCAGCCC